MSFTTITHPVSRFLFKRINDNNVQKVMTNTCLQQECIPVGCVPPALAAIPACMARGHVWQEGCMAKGHAWQERRPLQQTVCILLECILVNEETVAAVGFFGGERSLAAKGLKFRKI